MTETQQDLPAVLGCVPSGLFVLTARSAAGEETGMLASWVQQAGFEPPAITVAVKNGRYLNNWLKETARAAVSIVGETQKGLLGRFSKGFEPGENAFDGLATWRTSDGIPVLADGIGWLAGDVTGSVPAGDHTIYVIRLSEAGAGPRIGTEKPWVHIRRNGLGY